MTGPKTHRIVELRRYALQPGARETLIELFDRELVETQEEVGMHVLGQFRDLDDPDAFVWLRGFSDMSSRKRGLEAFYGGPVWKQHAAAANATMIDSDNVLLLRPLSGLSLDPDDRPAPGSAATASGMLVITIYPLLEPTAGEFPAFFAREVEPALHEAGISVARDVCHRAQREHLSRAPGTRRRRSLRLDDDLRARGRPLGPRVGARGVPGLVRSNLTRPGAVPGRAARSAQGDTDLTLAPPWLIRTRDRSPRDSGLAPSRRSRGI